MLNKDLIKKLEKIFEDGIPQYIKVINGSRVRITLMEGKYDFTLDDVVKYYRWEAPKIYTGIRKLGPISDDWKYVDNIAKELLEIFKVINKVRFKNACKKAGLKPKF